MSDERRFAFDTDVATDGCECPAVAAEKLDPDTHRPPSRPIVRMIDAYDSIANTLGDTEYDQVWGTLPEDKAKRAWLSALDDVDGKAREYGEAVADELGWL